MKISRKLPIEGAGVLDNMTAISIMCRDGQSPACRRVCLRLGSMVGVRIVMDVSLLIQLCGLPLFLGIVGVSLSLTVFAFYLALVAREATLLSMFLSLTTLPAMIALVASLSGILSSVESGFESGASSDSDLGLVLLMHLAIVVFGCVASLPPALVTMLGRWRLLWQLSGLRLFPAREKESQQEDQDALDSRETEDYLERMVKYH